MITRPDELQMILPPEIVKRRTRTIGKPWPQMDTGSVRPGYGLRPERVWSAFRQAEQGDPSHQCDIFEDVIENDGHARGQLIARYGGNAFKEWMMLPGADDEPSIELARTLERALRSTNMLGLMWHLMEAIGVGYSGVNTAWSLDAEGNVMPAWFLLAAHRRFAIDNDTDSLLWRTAEDYQGKPLELGEWFEARRPGRKVARAGILRTVTWWVLFKRLSVTDWIVFAEKFGLPIVLGTYEERASEASRAALLKALEDIGTDGQAVLSRLTDIVFKEPSVRGGDVKSLHPMIATRCDEEISKIITGGILNVSSGGSGSYGLGAVHQQREVELWKGDALWLRDVMLHNLVIPAIAYNPRFAKATPAVFTVLTHLEGKDEATKYDTLQQMGVEIDAQDMRTRFGLRRPAKSGALKRITNEPAPPQPPAT